MGQPYAEVIGDPIAHSKSPLIHNRWLRRLGVAGEYRSTFVRSSELGAFLELRRSDPDWRGCNVTLPHKELVIEHLDRLGLEVRAIGAANCVGRIGQELVGYNSDAEGVGAALEGVELEGTKAAIIGGGGAARAALHHLAARSVREISVLVRDPRRYEQLKLLKGAASMHIGCLSDASTLLEGSAVIINASPLGMRGGPPMPTELLSVINDQEGTTVFDMVYDPVLTPFLQAGRSRRIDGLSMLVGQAARAFELFFGLRPPSPDSELMELLKSV
jgi:shikimate dehydrogenase